MHNRLRISLFTGYVARWSVSVALCRNILHIRLVVCVGRDAKERGLERHRFCDVILVENVLSCQSDKYVRL